jgi:hypothetical protein
MFIIFYWAIRLMIYAVIGCIALIVFLCWAFAQGTIILFGALSKN